MKTLINALLIGSLMTTVAFAGDPAPKADKTAPAKKDDKMAPPADKTAPATDAKATDKTAPKTDAKATDAKKDAKKDVKAPATK